VDIKIKINHWEHTCADGCCTTYGSDINVNGKQIKLNDYTTENILKEVLTELGFNVEIIETYDEI
jgi:hypothetical protein